MFEESPLSGYWDMYQFPSFELEKVGKSLFLVEPCPRCGLALAKVIFAQSFVFPCFSLGMSSGHFCTILEHLHDIDSSYTFLFKAKPTKKLFIDTVNLKIKGDTFQT